MKLLLLSQLVGLQMWIIFLDLLVIKVKDIITFDGHHFTVIYGTIIVSVQNIDQFLQLTPCHRNAGLFHASHEGRLADLLGVFFVQLPEEIHHTQASQFNVLQQQIQDILVSMNKYSLGMNKLLFNQDMNHSHRKHKK